MSDLPNPPADVEQAETGSPVSEPESATASTGFDFEAHAREATERYQTIADVFRDFAYVLEAILRAALEAAHIQVHTLESRGKDLLSFQTKASQVSDADPSLPKYSDPLTEITDLAGARVITFFLNAVETIRELIPQEFEILEEIDKTLELEKEGRFVGYQSVHYIVKLDGRRIPLPEYARFENLVGELQIRTIVQHAWAEIEHDIQYKSVGSLPSAIRKRFAQLAGLLAIADREFQSIENEDERLRAEARESVSAGRLEGVELTSDALKAYLDKRMGADGRMSEWVYQWSVRNLKKLGFENIEQLDQILDGLDDDEISRKLWGNRQGQITRFEDMMVAAMGQSYLQHSPYASALLTRFESAGLPIGQRTIDGQLSMDKPAASSRPTINLERRGDS